MLEAYFFPIPYVHDISTTTDFKDGSCGLIRCPHSFPRWMRLFTEHTTAATVGKLRSFGSIGSIQYDELRCFLRLRHNGCPAGFRNVSIPGYRHDGR